jgi:hypothetical protein
MGLLGVLPLLVFPLLLGLAGFWEHAVLMTSA